MQTGKRGLLSFVLMAFSLCLLDNNAAATEFLAEGSWGEDSFVESAEVPVSEPIVFDEAPAEVPPQEETSMEDYGNEAEVSDVSFEEEQEQMQPQQEPEEGEVTGEESLQEETGEEVGAAPEETLPEGICGPELTWKIKDQVLEITGAGPMYDYSLCFEGETGTYFSTAPWEAYKGEILGLLVGEGVTSLGGNAFADCTSLTYALLGESLTSIGDSAFWGCGRLDEINIPDNVGEIGRCAFAGCRSLREVELPQNLSMVSWEAFLGCVSLQKISIPENVWCIDGSAFRGCVALEKVIFPEGLFEIGPSAFSMTNLQEVILPASVQMLGFNSFYGCNNLTLEVYYGSAGHEFARESSIPYLVLDAPEEEVEQSQTEEEKPREEATASAAAPKGYLSLSKTKQILFTTGSTYDREFILEVTRVGLSGTVKYKSTDKSVATVDSAGLVQAKGTGKAYITAYLEEDGEVYKARCKVVVKRGRIIVGQERLSLLAGDSCGIIATVQPSGKITYESKDRSVARVNSSGVVTGISPGKTKIVLRCGGITQTLAVEVK